MFILYHHPADPFSRKARLVLAENGLEFSLREEESWKRRPAFLSINPACEIPVLEEPSGRFICGHRPVCEYIAEITSNPLMGFDAFERAEVRRLCDWFDDKLYKECTLYLAGEKIFKRLQNKGAPDSIYLRAGKQNIIEHMKYTEWLLKHRKWLAGEKLTMADIAAAAQFSVLDYIGEIPWDKTDENKQPLFEETHNWYARIKSRPSFQPLLADKLANLMPAKHYTDLDF